MLMRIRVITVLVTLVASLLLSGCTAVQGLFDEQFLSALGAGTGVASLPGDAPALLVAVENGTDRVVVAVVSYRGSSGETRSFTTLVEPFEQTAQALVCPIEEITLGDVSNGNAIGAVVRLGNGTAADPFIEVEPFGVLLQEGVNYDCGDGLTFSVQPSTATLSGYQTFVSIRHAQDGS